MPLRRPGRRSRAGYAAAPAGPAAACRVTQPSPRGGTRITCCRCSLGRALAARFPDGPLCTTSLDRSVRTRGTCPGCGQD